MEITPSKITGCYELQPNILWDDRGRFVKVFHQGVFAKHGLETCFAEEYYSVSQRGVLRGMHFQTPPMDHTKMVYCIAGAVLDVVVDLRLGSPTYGEFVQFDLNAEKGNIVYIPPGLAHGFYALSDSATLIYKVTTVYSPEHDSGILWDSAGIPWPDSAPILSTRDKGFPALKNFVTPFILGDPDGE